MPRALLVILIIVGVYYGFKYLSRYLFPLLLKRFMNKMGNGQFNQFNQFQQTQQAQKPEGEVTITKRNKKEPGKGDNDNGEYVDFEEVN